MRSAVYGIMLQALLIFELLYHIIGTENSEILPNRVERKDTMKKITLLLSVLFIILTFAGAGYVLYNGGKVNAGYAVVPMVFALISIVSYRNRK